MMTSSRRIHQRISTVLKLCYIYVTYVIFSDNIGTGSDAFPQTGFMPVIRKRALDALDGDDFTLKRKRALDGMEGDGFGFRKRALDNLEGDDFGGLRKRALDMLEGDGFGLEKKKKRALDALEGSGFGLKKRSILLSAWAPENEQLQWAIRKLNYKRAEALDELHDQIDSNRYDSQTRQNTKRALDALEGNSFGFR